MTCIQGGYDIAADLSIGVLKRVVDDLPRLARLATCWRSEPST